MEAEVRLSATADEPIELAVPRAHLGGVSDVLAENARDAHDHPVVAPELADQMVAAIRAFLSGAPVPPVDRIRIESEFAPVRDAAWARTGWTVVVDGITRRRARILQVVVDVLRIAPVTSTLDPQRTVWLPLDVAQAAALRAALPADGGDDSDDPDGVRSELDRFLAQAVWPVPVPEEDEDQPTR